MTSLTIRTKIAGVLTDVTAVLLSDPTGTFGMRQGDTGPVVVADGTAMTRTTAGTYAHAVELPATGLMYTWWTEVHYGGRTYHIERQYYAQPVIEDVELSELDQIDVDNADFFLAEYGERGIIHPPSGLDREVKLIVKRQGPDLQESPRAEIQPVIVQVRNDPTAGIAAAEISTRWFISVRRQKGGPFVKLRVTRWPEQDAAFITVELT
ncbi:MAG: hypothetical protein ABFE13_18080 [Phycisphaerales bacterium]